jgi:hypothetical protein
MEESLKEDKMQKPWWYEVLYCVGLLVIAVGGFILSVTVIILTTSGIDESFWINFGIVTRITFVLIAIAALFSCEAGNGKSTLENLVVAVCSIAFIYWMLFC